MSVCVPPNDPQGTPGRRSGIVIFARSDSRRLPGKVLRPLAGRPMLAWTIARMQRSRMANVIALATSDRRCDDPVAALGEAAGIPVIRGSRDDVLGRASQAMQVLGLHVLVRISGDSPFADAVIVDDLLTQQAESGADLVTNVYPKRRLAPGLSVEAISRKAMDWLLAHAASADDREHVTKCLYHEAKAGSLPLVLESGGPRRAEGRQISLAVDTETDFARASSVAASLGDGLETAKWQTILALYRSQHVASATQRPHYN